MELVPSVNVAAPFPSRDVLTYGPEGAMDRFLDISAQEEAKNFSKDELRLKLLVSSPTQPSVARLFGTCPKFC
jgi:hypothetical protein